MDIFKKICICPAFSTISVHLDLLLVLSVTVTDFGWHIKVNGTQHILIDQGIECPFRYRNEITVVFTDMRDGLPFPLEKGCNDIVDLL